MSQSSERLKVIGRRLAVIDQMLVHLFARRLGLSREVAMTKMEGKDGLYRGNVEKKRLADIAKWAKQEGVNPHFARSMLYQIIGESIKEQMVIADRVRLGHQVERLVPTYPELRKNLIRLTRAWAPKYEAQYTDGHPATCVLIERERRMIDRLIGEIPSPRPLALDLGCATGMELRRISKRFRRLQGFDISPHMVRVGMGQVNAEKLSNVSLAVHDIETQLPVDDGAASLVIMNLGTGSDISNLDFVLREITRVLCPRGRFLISFYNKEAWVQRTFFPWPLSLVAEIDPIRECLEVSTGKKRIPIFARPYTVDQLREMMPNGLSLSEWITHPALASVLPMDVYMGGGSNQWIDHIDEGLASGPDNIGAYITMTGQKA